MLRAHLSLSAFVDGVLKDRRALSANSYALISPTVAGDKSRTSSQEAEGLQLMLPSANASAQPVAEDDMNSSIRPKVEEGGIAFPFTDADISSTVGIVIIHSGYSH